MAADFGFEPKTEKPYLFISYNSEDAHRIAPIARRLNRMQVPLWYDRALFVGQETWERQIAERIDSSEALLMFITKGIFRKSRSSFVHMEYKLAETFSNKPIYVVLLDKIESDEIPLDMRVWWVKLISNQCITCYDCETEEQKAAEIMRNLQIVAHKILPVNRFQDSISLDYSLDIVFCVCSSSSMLPYADNVTNTCKRLPYALNKEMTSRGKSVSQTRIRMVVFHNYVCSSGEAMLVTDFFDHEQKSTDYEAAVDSISFTKHPTSEGCNAMEALAYAIRSEWSQDSIRKRQVIILWINEKIVPLGSHSAVSCYPKGMASDLQELREWWYKMDRSGRRLIIFAPNDQSDMLYQLSEWDRSIILPITLSDMGDNSFADISRMICASI